MFTGCKQGTQFSVLERKANMDSIKKEMGFLRADLWSQWDTLETDQKKHLPAPPVQKPFPGDAELIPLIPPEEFQIGQIPLIEVIRGRRSRRIYKETALSVEELSFLLWATQGIRQLINEGVTTLRTVPSGGARHPFETYLAVLRVNELQSGLYRYLPLEHKLLFLQTVVDFEEKLKYACSDFAHKSAVVFAWTAIPYRTAWRYGSLAPKLIAQDSGHVCQNLYLACGAIGAGACAVGAYNQNEMDALLGVDGIDEFTVYCAPVGKVN
jgi:SagB-type dehydrogenase family enzyme